MTKTEILTYTRHRLDAITSQVSPSWEDSELSTFLDRAQDIIVKNKYENGNLNDLAEITLTDTIGSANISQWEGPFNIRTTGYLKPIKVPFSALTNYQYYITSYSKITRPNENDPVCVDTDEWVENELIPQVASVKFLTTSFNRPYFWRPKCYLTGDDTEANLVILLDCWSKLDVTGEYVAVSYISQPTRITGLAGGTAPDLNSKFHGDICDKAAELAKLATRPEEAAINIQSTEKIKQE